MAVPRLVLPRLHPEKRLWKWTRLEAAVELGVLNDMSSLYADIGG
jgi:hypothetical protein